MRVKNGKGRAALTSQRARPRAATTRTGSSRATSTSVRTRSEKSTSTPRTTIYTACQLTQRDPYHVALAVQDYLYFEGGFTYTTDCRGLCAGDEARRLLPAHQEGLLRVLRHGDGHDAARAGRSGPLRASATCPVRSRRTARGASSAARSRLGGGLLPALSAGSSSTQRRVTRRTVRRPRTCPRADRCRRSTGRPAVPPAPGRPATVSRGHRLHRQRRGRPAGWSSGRPPAAGVRRARRGRHHPARGDASGVGRAATHTVHSAGDCLFSGLTRSRTRLGYGPRPSQTAYEYADRLGELVPVARSDLELIATAKVEAVYGRRQPALSPLMRIATAYRHARIGLLRLVVRRPRLAADRARPARRASVASAARR